MTYYLKQTRGKIVNSRLLELILNLTLAICVLAMAYHSYYMEHFHTHKYKNLESMYEEAISKQDTFRNSPKKCNEINHFYRAASNGSNQIRAETQKVCIFLMIISVVQAAIIYILYYRINVYSSAKNLLVNLSILKRTGGITPSN